MRDYFSILILMAFALSIPDVNAKQIVWKLQSHRVPGAQTNLIFKKYIIEPINKEFEGKFKIILYPQNHETTLFSNRTMFSAVKYCQIDGMFGAPMYWRGANPNFSILGDLVPGWPSKKLYDEWYQREGYTFFDSLYSSYNMHFIGKALSPRESMISWSPIRNVNDIKGKVVRVAPGGLSEIYFLKLGAIPRALPMTKAMPMLEGRTIDIADFGNISSNLEEGLYTSAKHTNYPGFHSMPIFDFVVCKKRWNVLPKKIQDRILEVTKVWEEMNFKEQMNRDKMSIELMKKKNVKIYKWTDKSLKEARKLGLEAWNEYKEKYPQSRALLNSIIRFLKEKKQI